jgi:hypothetical protein
MQLRRAGIKAGAKPPLDPNAGLLTVVNDPVTKS